MSRSYLGCIHFGLVLALKVDAGMVWVGGKVGRKIGMSGNIVTIGST